MNYFTFKIVKQKRSWRTISSRRKCWGYYHTFPSFIVYPQNSSCKSRGVWIVRYSWVISVAFILSKNNFIISNREYWFKNLHTWSRIHNERWEGDQEVGTDIDKVSILVKYKRRSRSRNWYWFLCVDIQDAAHNDIRE